MTLKDSIMTLKPQKRKVKMVKYASIGGYLRKKSFNCKIIKTIGHKTCDFQNMFDFLSKYLQGIPFS